MNMNNILLLLVALAGGMVVSLVYFGGLKVTIDHIVTARNPALLMIGSYLLRTVFAILAFYIIMNGELIRLIACIIGFILGRFLLIRLLGPQKPKVPKV